MQLGIQNSSYDACLENLMMLGIIQRVVIEKLGFHRNTAYLKGEISENTNFRLMNYLVLHTMTLIAS